MKPNFRISTLLWITLAFSCFFAGMSWDDFYERARVAFANTNTVAVQLGSSVLLMVPLEIASPKSRRQ